MNEEELKKLREISIRIRRHIVTMTGLAKSGHPGGSLSAADIITVLFFKKMRIDPKNPRWKERDIFILSKGHATPVLYAALAEAGFFPVEELKNFRRLRSHLQGHPDRLMTPGVEMSTGSLGQGLSVANGVAMAFKIDKTPRKVYVLIGDGELQEGQIWEAAMTAAHYKLDNLTAIVDYNGLQIDGPVSKVKEVAPVAEKWKAFGWEVKEIDGHDFKQIIEALDWADGVRGKPAVIIAHTLKGKGISFMEGKVKFHGVPPSEEEMKKALEELDKQEREIRK
ncbi:MAG: transketolase [Candidatus Aminicenantes bacterium]|nr:transketolase [Candidatus Aminicenantes bacterium]